MEPVGPCGTGSGQGPGRVVLRAPTAARPWAACSLGLPWSRETWRGLRWGLSNVRGSDRLMQGENETVSGRQ